MASKIWELPLSGPFSHSLLGLQSSWSLTSIYETGFASFPKIWLECPSVAVLVYLSKISCSGCGLQNLSSLTHLSDQNLTKCLCSHPPTQVFGLVPKTSRHRDIVNPTCASERHTRLPGYRK